MNAVLQLDGGPFPESRDAKGRNDRNPCERGESLRRAVRTLRAIRQRYDMRRHAHPGARFFDVQLVVDGSDMAWIAAAIEALEQAIPGQSFNT
jgi:hypothetical protein